MSKARRIKPGAIAQYFSEQGWSCTPVEFYSSTCAHCQKGTDFPSMRKMMDYVDICRNCMRLICLECHGKPCTPFMRIVEKMEEEAERKRMRLRIGI